MDEARMIQIFFEIHSDLPREGPGDRRSTEKAFLMLGELGKNPYILDVGCGPGMQTLDILEFTDGRIVAVDNHQPFLEQLAEKLMQKGIADRVQILNADMSALEFPPETFDVIWSEGAAYSMGFENALIAWKPFLKQHGYLAVSELTWTRPDPPDELRRFFVQEYPAMKDTASNLDAVRRAGYGVVGHFTLPESSWWDHYYTPIEKKIPALHEKYSDDPDARAVVDLNQVEIDMYRKYADFYGYVFYVMQNV